MLQQMAKKILYRPWYLIKCNVVCCNHPCKSKVSLWIYKDDYYICYMITRTLQADISRLLKGFPAVCILGPRQVGKTTLAKTLADTFKKKALYLDLENPLDKRRLSDAFTFLTDNADRCIILDEIQVMPHLFAVLRSVIDANRRNGKFILLGSASPELVKGVSESLAGRIAYRELTPLNVLELPHNIDKKKHWLRGGFPPSLLNRSEGMATEWMNGFTRSYIERDLTILFGVEFTASITAKLLSMLAHTHGQVWNAEMISRSIGITAPTVNRYIDYLQGAYLIHRLQPFHINTKKRLVKAPKIYIRDSGMLHAISSINKMNALKGNPLVGNSWEGYVVEQVLQAMPAGLQLYYYRTQAGAECDMVIARGVNAIASIEVKLSNAPVISKGNYQSIADLKTNKNFVIVPDIESYKTASGILICNFIDFMQNHLPKLK